MEKKHYPSWRYHKTLEPMVIHSEDDEPGEDWAHSPAEFESEAPIAMSEGDAMTDVEKPENEKPKKKKKS